MVVCLGVLYCINFGVWMLCLYVVFMKLLMGVWVYFVFVKEISDFVSGRFDGIRIVGIVFG